MNFFLFSVNRFVGIFIFAHNIFLLNSIKFHKNHTTSGVLEVHFYIYLNIWGIDVRKN